MRWDWQIGRRRRSNAPASAPSTSTTSTGSSRRRPDGPDPHTWQAATLPHPKAICYLDLAWEDTGPTEPRPSTAEGSREYAGEHLLRVPQERWFDLRRLWPSSPCRRPHRHVRAQRVRRRRVGRHRQLRAGVDERFQSDAGDAQNLLAWLDNEIHRNGMTVLWKNTGILSWWGRDYSDGAVVEECYVYSECFSSQVAGGSNVGITCTALAGPTPCGWDDFTTDVTANQPTGKWVGEAEYGADHYVCDPGQTCPHKKLFATYCTPSTARARLRGRQVRRQPGREDVLPVSEASEPDRGSGLRPASSRTVRPRSRRVEDRPVADLLADQRARLLGRAAGLPDRLERGIGRIDRDVHLRGPAFRVRRREPPPTLPRVSLNIA